MKKFFINHGEMTSADSFAQHLRDELGADVYAPFSGAEFDLISGEITVDAEAVFLPKKERQGNIYTFECSIAPDEAGSYKTCIRMFPKDDRLPHRQDFCYVKWL